MRGFNERAFLEVSRPPLKDEGDEWLKRAEDSIEFLKLNARSDEIVIYGIASAALIHGVLAPTAQVTPADHKDLLNSCIFPDDCWRIERAWGGGHGHRIYLDPPLSSPRCTSLVGGEPLIFRRSFSGVDKGPAPVELSQKLVHSLDLYHVEERSAYCRLDRHGDIEDVIRVIQLKEQPDGDCDVVVTILAADLARYATLADMCLVLKFDFTRYGNDFDGWDQMTQREVIEPDLFYNTGLATNASYANGCMIMRSSFTVEDLIQVWKDEDDPDKKEYATFKIIDRKNKALVETSCAPEYLSNYFEESDLPWEISPAFFKPEVLHRFKSDPEKYDLQDRSITCRGTWHLKSYDINEEGQVHAYIGDLRHLPFEEQRYWQSFNEWPKGTISKRAFENDILGEFSSEYDPLAALKYKIRQLDETPPAWWKRRGEELHNAARYPATDSVSEWADEILALDQLLVEGFLTKPLQVLLREAGREIDPQWKPLRLLQDYLEAKGTTPEDARETLSPLAKLHSLRNPLKGHGSTSERSAAQKQARAEHGTLRAHYTDLASQCDAALNAILTALGSTIDLGTWAYK